MMNTKIGLVIGVLVVGGVFSLVVFSNQEEGEERALVATEERGSEEEVVEGTVELVVPAGMPTNVPMYPGAILRAVQDTEQEGERNISLTLGTPDSVADVNTWYRGALKQNGWAVTSDKNVGGYILLKGENENVTVFTQVAPRSDLGLSIITQRIQIK